jgi:hypothetical protein
MYVFTPEKTPSLVGRNFCLAILKFLRVHKGSLLPTPYAAIANPSFD